MDELLAICAAGLSAARCNQATKLAEVFASMKDWMNL